MATLLARAHHDALEAMGVSNLRLTGMSLLQALVVGGAACFGLLMEAVAKTVPPAFTMTWQIVVISAVAVQVIVLLASVVSIRRVLVLEPAVVFK